MAALPEVDEIQQRIQQLRDQVGQVIVGKAGAVELLIVALCCEGHVLLEDVPGIGKTTMAKTLAKSLGCSFRRIQFTPDVLPSDITGVSIFNQKTGEFEFRSGPLQAQVVLADEINRAGPRTQSALLEAMEERQVTVDGETRPLPYPFLVLATQNPVELEGTFPLPEAQLDRFLVRVAIGYPDREQEREIIHRFRTGNPLADLQPILSTAMIQAANQHSRGIYVHAALEDYMLDLVRTSRTAPAIELGVSPRGTLALYRASQALAFVRGRSYVLPDDVKQLALPVLAHRLILASDARLRGQSAAVAVTKLLESIPIPVEERWSQSQQH